MADEPIGFDDYTLIHLVAAQLVAGMSGEGDTAPRVVARYHEVLEILKDAGLDPRG